MVSHEVESFTKSEFAQTPITMDFYIPNGTFLSTIDVAKSCRGTT